MKHQLKIFALGLPLFFSISCFGQTSALNSPKVSADALFLYRNSNLGNNAKSLEPNGIDLQEAELSFYSDVDPYSRLTMLLTVHPEYTLNSTTHKVTRSWEVEPEVLTAESSSIPDTTLTVGKFKAAFGKHNLLHSHVFPFVDAPLANTMFLGDDGLNDLGVSADFFLPFSWYSDFTVQYLRGKDGNEEFNSSSPNDGVALGHFKNLFDLSDSTTFESGLSFAGGKNSLGGNTTLAGLDLTLKWRPVVGGKYHSGILAGELINRHLEQPGTHAEKGLGWNVWGQYQFAERWSVLARYDNVEVQGSEKAFNPNNFLTNETTQKYSVALHFQATEFSEYHLEFDQSHPDISQKETKVYLQANFVIGAHPAHAY